MKNTNVFLIGSVVLILLAVALVAILDKTSTKNGANDVRARASAQQALNFVGGVVAADEAKNLIQVDNVQFAADSRSGAAQYLGAWFVTAPAGFNFASLSTGEKITISVDPKTVQVTGHTMTAISIVSVK